MYWSIHQYPTLRERPRAERQAIVQAALEATRGRFGLRLLVVFVAVVAASIAATTRLSPAMRLDAWRTWIAPVAGALFIYAYLLVEINGSIHSAVKKYLADKSTAKNPRKK